MTNTNTNINTMYTISIADAASYDNWSAVVYAPTLHDAILQFAARIHSLQDAAMYSIDAVNDHDYTRHNVYADTMPATIDDLNAAIVALMPNARLAVAS